MLSSKNARSFETQPNSLFIFLFVVLETCARRRECIFGIMKQSSNIVASAITRCWNINSKISKDLCTVKPAQHVHKIPAHYKCSEVRRVSRLSLDWLCLKSPQDTYFNASFIVALKNPFYSSIAEQSSSFALFFSTFDSKLLFH